jgi:glutaredoxin
VQCDLHGIAAGPDGRCALCRAAHVAEQRRQALSSGVRVVLGLAIALFALLGYGALRRVERSRAREQQATAEAQRNTTAAAAPHGEPASNAVQQPRSEPEATMGIAVAPPSLEPNAPSLEPNAPSLEPNAPSPAQPTTTTASAASVAPPSPTPEQIHAALAATPIVMFTASWCSVCRRAHAFLRANGLRCTDRDIDSEPAALRELKQRSGSTSVPTFEIDGELERPGFSERAVERALARSVERRLGVHGISIQR